MGRRSQGNSLSTTVQSAVRSEDPYVFEALFRYYQPRIEGHLRSWRVPEYELEDLVQETLIAVWEGAGSFDPSKGSVKGWIFAISRHLRIDQFRRSLIRLRALSNASREPYELPVETPFDVLQACQGQNIVRSALARLPSDQLNVVWLAYFEELSHSEIALRLALPIGTVKTRIRLASRRLRLYVEGGE